MNANDTTRRNGLRAGALTVLLATLALGAPAVALAGPNGVTAPTPGNATDPIVTRADGTGGPMAPTATDSTRPCLACTAAADPAAAQPGPMPTVLVPELTDTNSHTAGDPNLQIWGDQFTRGGKVLITVHSPEIDWHGTVVASGDGKGSVYVSIGSVTADGPVNGYAFATDLATGRVTSRLPVSAFHPPVRID
jgi:hypothetical protein